MTSDPFQLFVIILLLAGFPLMVWIPSRITELLARGEEARVPEALRWLANQKYLEAIYEGEIVPENSYRWRLFVAVIGLVLPIGMLCTATAENLVPGLILILTSVIVFFAGVALLEWLVRPRS